MDSNIEIDKIDLKILEIFQQNSKTPIEEISKQLGLSKSTVYYRANRLYKLGVIKRFSVDIDKKKLGYNIFAISAINAKFKQESLTNIAKKIKRIPGIEVIYVTLGDIDLFVTIATKDRNNLESIIEQINSLPEVEKTHTYYVMHQINNELL